MKRRRVIPGTGSLSGASPWTLSCIEFGEKSSPWVKSSYVLEVSCQ